VRWAGLSVKSVARPDVESLPAELQLQFSQLQESRVTPFPLARLLAWNRKENKIEAVHEIRGAACIALLCVCVCVTHTHQHTHAHISA
jgi:hypothetical protein